jgi:hypothetical protein
MDVRKIVSSSEFLGHAFTGRRVGANVSESEPAN